MSDSSDESDDFDPQEIAIVQELQRKQRKEQGEDSDSEKEFIYNKAGIQACLKQIALPDSFHWVETLSVTTSEPFVLENLQDDLKRESQFYADSLEGVKLALKRCEEMGIPYQRPSDFYAEMVKPDKHMARVKDSLLREKKKMAVVANRRERQKQQKMSKQVRAEQIKIKGAGKREAKANLEAIKARKGKHQTDIKVPRTLLSANVKAAAQANEERPTKSRKRKAKDAKFGYGGKKRRAKSNTAESLDDGYFPTKANKSRSFKQRIKGGKGQKRPGKNARRKNRNK